MITNTDLENVQKLINDFKPQIGFFEKNILIPSVHGRLEYIKSILKEFQNICIEPDVATHIDAAVKAVIKPQIINVKLPEPKVGEHYLKLIHQQIQNEYIAPVEMLMGNYDVNKTKNDIDLLVNYLNDVTNLLYPIPAIKDRLFTFAFRSFPNIKKIDTGEVILGNPQEISLILMPFQTRLEELVAVAQTTIDSIKEWAKQIREQKSKHVDSIVHVAQVKSAAENFKAAQENSRVANKNLIIQVGVIVFTLGTIIVSQRANLWLEKNEIEKALSDKTKKLEESTDNVNKKNLEIENLKTKILGLENNLRRIEINKKK